MMKIGISVQGAAYTAGALLLLTGGLLRGELLTAACGGILSAYIVFVLAALLITAYFWRREEPVVKVSGQVFTVCPEDTAFPFCTVGAAVYYTIVFSLVPPHAAAPVVQLSIPLQKGQTRFTAEPLPRGRYFYRRRSLIIRDFAGFFSITMVQKPDMYRTHNAVPQILPVDGLALPILRTEVLHRAPAAERTSELYESRPYFPGDDPRKIHWKLYAHTRNLSIKLGAYKPPPVKDMSIYIEEPYTAQKKDRQMLAPLFDAFIGRICFLILLLLEAGIRCTLMFYDYPQEEFPAPQRKIPQKKLRAYAVSNSTGQDAGNIEEIRKLLSIPAVSSVPVADMQEVFNAVPESGGLLYCYLPVPAGKKAKIKEAAQKLQFLDNTNGNRRYSAADTKVKAGRLNGVQTYFYLAAPPSVSGTAEAQTEKFRSILQQLCYPSAVSARQKALYRRLTAAAEEDLRIFTARNCHAETL